MKYLINSARAFLPLKSDSFKEARRKIRLWECFTWILQGIIIGIAMAAFMCFVLI